MVVTTSVCPPVERDPGAGDPLFRALALTSVAVGADDLCAVLRPDRPPRELADRVLAEAYRAVGEEGVDATGMVAARIAEGTHRRRAVMVAIAPHRLLRVRR